MSYQVLARKWRPYQFADVVGQSHVLTALGNALEQNRLHHAYLFSGTRGVGKTTIARIFAKGLNCEQGITSTPCGKCTTCREIDEGRFVDLLEIDAASRTKVEDTRELLDNVQYKPARGRFKVYLIDEVHMLSRHSFNALLKTLEEPPEYVKFILATTDPQKLPVTILSRCLQFHLKHLDHQQIHAQLDKVLTEEKVEYEARALALLARAAEGSMRDALSLTDQAIALGNGNVSAETVALMLGTLDTDQALVLLEAVATADANTAMASLQQLASIGIEWDSLLRELSAQLHRVAMFQALPASLDESLPDAERINLLSQLMTPQDVQLCYQICLQGRQDLSFAPDGRTGLEMVLLRMLAFRPVSGGSITPQTIVVPSSQPAPLAAPTPTASNGVSRVQALKAQMQTPVTHNVQPAVMPVSESQPIAPVVTASVPVAPSVQQQPPLVQQQVQQPSPQVQQPSQPAMQPPTEAAPARPSAASGLLAARNQLRSQTKRGQEGQTAATSLKKPLTAPAKKVATSVMDRIANKQTAMPSMKHNAMPASTAVDNVTEDDEYRWKPMAKPELNVEVKQELTPRVLKRALEHEKTPEMAKLLVNEAANQDSWSQLVTQLDVPKLIQQLALNSAFERVDDHITLYLRSSQKHLQAERATAQLNSALNDVLQTPIQLSIVLGEQGQTPLELRENLYQQKLLQARDSLANDPNVNFICQRFAAQLDEESIRPV
ncbi:DNA polymerase III subunit gamma/tau [Photobacterium iliopiscarium]|uniref:DNA polymerase III subunit gamma/tau n=2 Tax=Photobacterium iliopiscarium TaxID=56192 RepID=A0ABX5GP62_9GAMM|nr:DNA polymerase III subunit gamma/tau [Photobacterium iliopiscarium]KJG14923.1 DNA polymerase III subunit gamma/tau [Photobacterium iliopiscarium]KJG20553.1 DNA polymerase III subunit gamma/tau [Photobacterium iliopiscarium]PSU02024.1 DNA polymerase III subunit gamma/tau [Photobacterium iliopiscarium]PSV84372.1 DNA polymerase III subunit gamma/tau [Photobacterium iliopiscarium]PSW93212.1 DNA polymerase III subunit gamma/tau [Photobacterium iliopiscarium]